MLYSPSARQALRAVIYLARQDENVPVSARQIAEDEEIPHPFLSKLMHALQKQGLVISTMGPGGGYQLARSPKEIQVTEIIDGIDGSDAFGDGCGLGYESCNDEEGCVFHEEWKALRDQYQRTIGSLSLSDAAKTTRHEPGEAS